LPHWQYQVFSVTQRKVPEPDGEWTQSLRQPADSSPAHRQDAANADVPPDPARRDFLVTSTAVLGAAGLMAAAWPFLSSMNPTAAVKAAGVSEVSLQGIAAGEMRTVAWRGQPVFVFHRTPAEAAAMRDSNGGKDPQPDAARIQRPDWLVVVGTCTHLGCIPNKNAEGWLCPCHGSVYDNSGRILAGPAPRNLEVPPYRFLNDEKIVVG
jgi:ubiquinol-cytochrome c reductase iron-sulfur subunit